LRLSARDVADLPLACALFDRTGALVQATPEWLGFSLGALTYEAGMGKLVVAPDGCSPDVDGLVTELIGEVAQAATKLASEDRLVVEMLAASLAVVAGRAPGMGSGTVEDLLAYVSEGVRRTVSAAHLDVVVECQVEVTAPAALALGLVQLARNAVGHAGVDRLTLRVGRGPTFRVEWDDAGGGGAGITTSRRPDQRPRWGLGYTRLLADALGGVVTAPAAVGPGRVGTSIGLGSPRLSAPLAAAVRGQVERATRAWDEETGLPPGSPLDRRVLAAVAAAVASPGQIGYADILRARALGSRTWLAVAPQSSTGRARDVLRGLQHENALLAAPEPRATRIFGIASALSCALEGELPDPVPASIWERDFPPACAALGLDPVPVIDPNRLRFPEPRVTAYLLAELEGEVAEDAGTGAGGPLADPRLRLRPGPQRQGHPLVRLLGGHGGMLTLLD
jgi:hypothetical protein